MWPPLSSFRGSTNFNTTDSRGAHVRSLTHFYAKSCGQEVEGGAILSSFFRKVEIKGIANYFFN